MWFTSSISSRWAWTSQGQMVTPGFLILYISSVLKVWMNISQPSGQLALWSRTMTGTRAPVTFFYSSYNNNICLMLFFISYSDKMFPAFGFGAQIPPTWQVNESTSAVITVTNSQKFSIVFFPRCRTSFLSTSILQVHSVQVCYSDNISFPPSGAPWKWFK